MPFPPVYVIKKPQKKPLPYPRTHKPNHFRPPITGREINLHHPITRPRLLPITQSSLRFSKEFSTQTKLILIISKIYIYFSIFGKDLSNRDSRSKKIIGLKSIFANFYWGLSEVAFRRDFLSHDRPSLGLKLDWKRNPGDFTWFPDILRTSRGLKSRDQKMQNPGDFQDFACRILRSNLSLIW